MLQGMLINYWWQLLILAAVSYCVGNFCAAVFVSNRFIKKDIRQYGSKNPGTTNMGRVFGLKFALLTLVIDFFKAFVCALAGKLLFTSAGGAELGLLAGYLAGLAAVAGHIYPVFLGFKGGKGFASGAGALMALAPGFTALTMLGGFIFLLIVDRMSAMAMAFFLAHAIYHIIIYGQTAPWISTLVVFYFALLIISHRGNIARLMRGEEKRLNFTAMLKGYGHKKTRRATHEDINNRLGKLGHRCCSHACGKRARRGFMVVFRL
jgi:glycerol-3-phosphate acyltransferase PlsY